MKELLNDLQIKHVHPVTFWIVLGITFTFAATTFLEIELIPNLINEHVGTIVLAPGFIFITGISFITQTIWLFSSINEGPFRIIHGLMHITAAGVSTIIYMYIINIITILLKQMKTKK